MERDIDIESYDQAIAAIKRVLSESQVKLDKDAIHFFPWQQVKKGNINVSRMNKMDRIRKKQQKILNEAKHNLNDLLSLELAQNLASQLKYIGEDSNKIASKIKYNQERRMKRLSKKAYRKLKKMDDRHFSLESSFRSSHYDNQQHFYTTTGPASPTNLPSYTEAATEAMQFFSSDLAKEENKAFEEQMNKIKENNKHFLNIIIKARELIGIIDDIFVSAEAERENNIPVEKRRYIITPEPKKKALAFKEDLLKCIEILERYTELDEKILKVEFNIDLISKNQLRLGFKSAGYKLMEELLVEYKKEKTQLEREFEELKKGMNTFKQTDTYLRVNELIDELSSVRNFEFEQDRIERGFYLRESEKTPPMPYEDKKIYILRLIEEMSKSRTIYEEYLRAIAGKGPDRIKFKDFAQQKNIAPAPAEYEERVIFEESQKANVKKR